MFGTIIISIVTLMHVYVFWRAVSVPFIISHIPKKNYYRSRFNPLDIIFTLAVYIAMVTMGKSPWLRSWNLLV